MLGSKYFAARPTVPFTSIVADINLDMFLPLYPLKVIEVQGLTESSLGDSVRAAAKAQGVDVQTDREPEQNRFIRGDQYSFIRRGIPSLAFKFGYEFGSPEEKIRREWVRDAYKPNDDLKQTIDSEAARTGTGSSSGPAACRERRGAPAMERHELLQTVRERGIVHSPKDSHRHAAFAARANRDQEKRETGYRDAPTRESGSRTLTRTVAASYAGRRHGPRYARTVITRSESTNSLKKHWLLVFSDLVIASVAGRRRPEAGGPDGASPDGTRPARSHSAH